MSFGVCLGYSIDNIVDEQVFSFFPCFFHHAIISEFENELGNELKLNTERADQAEAECVVKLYCCVRWYN